MHYLLFISCIGCKANAPPLPECQYATYLSAGSLIKMVYVSSNNHCSTNDQQGQLSNETVSILNGNWNHSAFCGSLHFVKFETRMISECIKFLSSKKLQYPGMCAHMMINAFLNGIHELVSRLQPPYSSIRHLRLSALL